ncbi:hypothetical protein LTR37_017344 [Vermiconidia calcicola]|uniref:Uncharacterized protein n=1 Tax=Vermiconidia calcicola TaxID=1690605 RepID=A0ACC3MK84_9PEZI|nr:hypothetical protein LTR37_017344 [Vermiconidia calcicola]
MNPSPFRSAPFRTPPPDESSSPPPCASPKRKRKESLESESALSLQISTEIKFEHVSAPESNSPRTKIAEKLKDLDLRQVPPANLRSNENHGVKRKRLKRNHTIQEISPTESAVTETPQQIRSLQREGSNLSHNEVGETTDCRTKTASSPPAPVECFATRNGSPGVPVITRAETPSALQSLAGTDTESLGLSPSFEDLVDRSVSPLPQTEDLTSEQIALTWQDDEITGHELDPGGEDDGEGINGIGFRPTPAMAYARQQRRRQQVNEWKAREARDARQRRIERRRGSSGGDAGIAQGTLDTGDKRAVRFAGFA